ncbi:ATP-binding protein [Caulobacter sp. S45]|uniref:ATP-binding protein n=1 Tax=Caulobacter sp. S45 TaxID=1641861 RepID=UPI00131DD868|nr:ATP-binding protein [Caulobacter sp. S45]
MVFLQHDLPLVALAVGVCLVSTSTALRLMIYGARSKRRSGPALLMLGGACGGMGAWATSFIAFLAFQPQYPVGYETGGVLASLLVPVISGALGVFVTDRTPRPWNLPVWGVIFISGLGAMQFLGLKSLLVPGDLAPSPIAMVASLLCGGAFAVLSLRIALRAHTPAKFLLSSATMAMAICSLHFIGMVGLGLVPDIHAQAPRNLVSRNGLALGIAGLTGLLVSAGLGLVWLRASSRKQSLNLLQAVIEAMPQGLAYFDGDDRFVLGNEIYRRELASVGLTPKIGRTYRQTIEAAVAGDWGPDTVEGKRAWVEERLNARRDGAAEFDRETVDGRFLRVQSSRTGGGVVTVVSDITDLKRQAESLLLARDQSEEATRAKSRFLATMSHEIRTPLNGVLGMAQAMANDRLSKRQRERLDIIRTSGETLLAVLNDVLDISKIEAGKFEVEAIAFELDEVVGAARDAFASVAAEKNLDFTLAVETGAQGAYVGDPTRIRQILLNLLSNALKFTETGSVRVEVKAGAGEQLSFVVRDTGIGMTPDQAGRLFEKFTQADASTTRKYGGSGLGLAICYELAALMGGALEVESAIDRGSTFTLRLPLARADGPVADQAVEAENEPHYALRVLAAEDNAVNQLVLRTLLTQVGIEPVIVENGVQAVEAWARADWDVILMDVQMPQMDGPTATREIRARELIQGRVRTPIIAFTANAMAHQISAYREVGMDGFVAKPVETAKLFRAIEEALADAGFEEESPLVALSD